LTWVDCGPSFPFPTMTHWPIEGTLSTTRNMRAGPGWNRVGPGLPGSWDTWSVELPVFKSIV
jgi:hypothetical protein